MDPSWGQSILFVDEPKRTWYQHLKENWRVPAAIAAIAALAAPFVPNLATGTEVQKASYFALACLLSPLYFIRFWQEDRRREESPHYLEVFRTGLYFWLHGFENGAHPFTSFDRIRTVRWRRKRDQCMLELTVSGFSRVVDLSIDQPGAARILSLTELYDHKQTPFLAALKACLDCNGNRQGVVGSIA